MLDAEDGDDRLATGGRGHQPPLGHAGEAPDAAGVRHCSVKSVCTSSAGSYDKVPVNIYYY